MTFTFVRGLAGCLLLLLMTTSPAAWAAPLQDPVEQEAAKQESSADQADDQEGQADDQAEDEEVLAGHSYHGEVFNEGPRQGAYLMPGTGVVTFPATSENPEVQKYINQGVGQLHGFWYLEAERSFRQALTLDPDCAIAYWGAAMANNNNRERAKGFIEEAVARKEKASKREQMYIDALSNYLKNDAKDEKQKRQRGMNYVKALENIALDYPEDIEAKAFVALQMWAGRRDSLPVVSYHAASALIDEVLEVNPNHPAHHYKIHLWDYRKPEKALRSAALCGPSAPAIAHMWHMPGHIYSRLKRYEDAAWQQEASARVDHAHMMRDRVMPDEIHNFAHNNEWLIRNLIFVGRVDDALDLAKNMSELPRHPRYNTLSRQGSNKYGRQRLFNVLWQYRLWDEVVAIQDTPHLEPTDNESEQINRLKLVGSAHAALGHGEDTQAVLADIQQRIASVETEMNKAVEEALRKFDEEQAKKSDEDSDEKEVSEEKSDEEKDAEDKQDTAKDDKEADDKSAEDKLAKKRQKVEDDAKRSFESRRKKLEKAREIIEGYVALESGDVAKAWEKLKSDRDQDKAWIAELQFRSGEQDKAIEELQKQVDRRTNEVIPLATLAFVLNECGKTEEADKAFEKLRETSTSFDVDRPLFSRLKPIAERMQLGDDWRKEAQLADDIGARPSLDELGPFRWQPSAAREWTLVNAAGENRSLSDFEGRPVVVIFYLGYGCLHCVEQLQAFAPKMKDFEDAGIAMIAISTDDQEGLVRGLKDFEGDMPIPLVANPDYTVFKKYRCFDDFEDQPLHGTFLIDAEGQVRWQDIGYEPFMDHEFLLKESQRLLAQPRTSSQPAGIEVSKVD